jgi:hypothetical protein
MSSLSQISDADMPEQHEQIAHGYTSGEWERVAGSVDGWQKAWAMVKNIANEQCSGITPMSGGCYRSNLHIIYRFRCPFWNSHGCRWECRFVIAHSGCMYGPEKDVTKRAFHHRAHAIHVEMHPGDKHVNHLELSAQGPPPAWIPFVRAHPSALRWKKRQIVMWLHENNFADADKRVLARVQGT